MASIQLLKDPYIDLIKEIAVRVGDILFAEKKNTPRMRRAKALNLEVGTSDNFFLNTADYKSLSIRSYNSFCGNVKSVYPQLRPDVCNKFKTLKDHIDLRIKNKDFKIDNKSSSDKELKQKKSTNLLSKFVLTNWACFELDGDEKITKKLLQFGELDKDGLCEVFFHLSHESHGSNPLKLAGKAKFISGNELIVATLENTILDKAYEYTHFTIMVDGKIENIELCLGHKTFVHYKTGNIVTKSIVLEKLVELSLTPQKFLRWGTVRIKQRLFEYFKDREFSRLAFMRDARISNYDDFSRWIHEAYPPSVVSDRLEAEYKIFVPDKSGNPICYGYINISPYTETVGNLIKNKKDNQVWVGRAEENLENATLTFILNGPFKYNELEFVEHLDVYRSRSKKYISPIIIALQVSYEDTYDTLVGTIADSWDEKSKSSRCHLAVLKKEGKYGTDSKYHKFNHVYDVNIIKDFFKKYSQMTIEVSKEIAVKNFAELTKLVKK